MNNELDKYLPIGSIVKINPNLKRVMIIGFAMQTIKEANKIYDYIGCIYPEGLLNTTEFFKFNHEDILEICVKGFSDQEERDFKVELKEKLSKIEVKQ